MLDGLRDNQDAIEPSCDQEQHNGADSARGSMSNMLLPTEGINGLKIKTKFKRFGSLG